MHIARMCKECSPSQNRAENMAVNEYLCLQESTIGAAFLTKTIPEKGVKFEIW